MHDENTRAALLDAAELIVTRLGPHALSIRTVADEVGTTTRAVYSLFGSKGGLVGALAKRAFDVLGERVVAHPTTDDPVADLVDLGATTYRGFVLEHPSLYRIAFQRVVPELDFDEELTRIRAETWKALMARIRRIEEAGRLARGDALAAAVEFNAMCEGMANAELRGGTLRALPREESGRVWREAFETIVRGLTSPP